MYLILYSHINLLVFQYCGSMQKPLMAVCLFMASFSDGYLSENSSLVMKFASSVLGGSRYVMDPELRAQKVISSFSSAMLFVM